MILLRAALLLVLITLLSIEYINSEPQYENIKYVLRNPSTLNSRIRAFRNKKFQSLYKPQLQQQYKLDDLDFKLKKLENRRQYKRFEEKITKHENTRKKLHINLSKESERHYEYSEEGSHSSSTRKSSLPIRLQREIKKLNDLEFQIRLQLHLVKRAQLEIRMKELSNPTEETELEELRQKLQSALDKHKRLHIELRMQKQVVQRVRQLTQNESPYDISALNANRNGEHHEEENIDESEHHSEKKTKQKIILDHLRNQLRSTTNDEAHRNTRIRSIRLYRVKT